MTPDHELSNLVELLANGHNYQRLNWTLTSDPNIFRLVLNEGLIRIERTQKFTPEESRPTPHYGIVILDKSGAQVLGGSDMYRWEDFTTLAHLYEQVSKHLHGEVVGKIMNELQSRLDKMPA